MSPGGPPHLHVTQLGFPCSARKRVVMDAGAAAGAREFAVQHMEHSDAEALGALESWKTVHRGTMSFHTGPMGTWLVGDFTPVAAPGLYRAVVPGRGDTAAWSFPFPVADGAHAQLPSLFLDYVHGQRCGNFENELRGPCHLDDAVSFDTGVPVDVVGGWHDAGDLRKWMATAVLPILGFFEIRARLGMTRNHWHERPHEDDLLAEAAWGLRWMLKMQDQATGMFWEDVGGGGDSRRLPGMSWWYENHAGCYADNADNRFTDNRRGSGDERRVRAQYNPVVQYVAISILLDAVDQFNQHYPAFSQLCREAALRCWAFMETRRRDDFHGWTSVLSWRLLAALRLHAIGRVPQAEVAALVSVLLDLQSADHGFWFMDRTRGEPYRGIVNAAQPVIALAAFIENDYEHPLVAPVRRALELCRDRYVTPLLATNPFGMMPYGVFSRARTEGDTYHPWKDGLVYRFYMPDHAPERVNHGLSSHWTSWAHALSLMAAILEDPACREAALDQLGWLGGCNPLNACMISGTGMRNATPYSRAYGMMPGGFCIGPRGTDTDEIWVDMEGRTVWSSGEYWMAPLANTLMALANLLPVRIPPAGKIG